MYIGAPAKGVRVVLAEGVGVVLADHCSYMYIGAGQRRGAGTGRPLLVHVHWCWPEVWGWYWLTTALLVHVHWCWPEVWGWYWPTTARTCTLVLARGVGLVLADHCSYMYIGAGQRCGAGTGRPPNLSMTCTSKILKSSRIFDLCKLISHHGQEPKYLKQLKNDKESVGFLMVLMRGPAGACPGHVQESRPTPQAFIITPAEMQADTSGIDNRVGRIRTMLCTSRQADTSDIDNRVGRIRTKGRTSRQADTSDIDNRAGRIRTKKDVGFSTIT
ncbi:uncharacterized protein EDB91DRAFT_1087727 [Suillus paluster]|uniref:uncharacterized protein n=1 Tax=Suillus paluster TaxID=48578 RepID=UPI001B86DA54|nr:uncharacterized protein EDB91DRAFT_1087727 [Suillus paluster]KAG1723735.1 hypothetical protein EDB91DRAFT_1087727 [Suillus paluster]